MRAEDGRNPQKHEECYINFGAEDQMELEGYKKVNVKMVVTWIFIFLTLGFLRLVFHWRPHWYLWAAFVKCSLFEADRVLLKDQFHVTYVEVIKQELVPERSQQLNNGIHLDINTQQSSSLDVKQNSQKYFINKKIKYLWNEDLSSYEKLRGLDEGHYCSYFHETTGLSEDEQIQKWIVYGKNAIVVRVTPVLKLLVTEGLNPFYVFQIFSVTLWFIDEYMFYAATILIMSCISLSTQIYQTRAMQRALKRTVMASDNVSVSRKSEEYEMISSEDLVPGDIIEIPRHGCTMQCDSVLIAGNCIVNESMLTGESVPVTKTPLPNPKLLGNHMDTLFCLKEHSRHVLFCGTKVIQTRFYGKQKVKAVVLRTGFSTAKGELIRSILFPKPSDFKFSQDSFKFIGVLFLISLFGMVYTFAIMIIRGSDFGRIIIRSLDLITIVVPPALPAAMTFGVVFAQSRLKKKNIFCISPNSINQCGALNVVCFDKTGTLTEDGLDMWGVVPTEKNGFEEVVMEIPSLGRRKIMCSMATCHSLTIIEGEIVGDPLDSKMFESTTWEIDEPGEDTTKYDVIMPTIVKPRKPDVVQNSETLGSEENVPFEIGIVRQFTFSSKLQRMSVITRTLGSKHFDLYAKGSPEMIASLCKSETLPRNFHDVLMHYTQQGYRVIGLAWKPLKKMNYVKIQRAQREQMEVGLEFLGLLVMENRLKPQTTPVIRELKMAAIRPVMVTGDNMLTALSVARDCCIIEQGGKVIFPQVTAPSGNDVAQIVWSYAEDINKDVKEIVFETHNTDGMVVKLEETERLHFALTGVSWEKIRKYFPEVLSKLVVWGTVFARMSPEQKQQLIEELQDLGYYVGMCGDGANDCGALKTAHAGISLSEAEASVASPFTSKEPNISCVPNVIREGRGALVTSFGVFKYMACYSLTQFASVCLLYWISANLTDFTFLYIDLFLLTSLSITFGYTGAYTELVPKAPQISLLSKGPIISILIQMAVNLAVQLITWFAVKEQPWYEPFVPNDELDYQTHLVTAVFIVSSFQYIILAVVFSKGAPYRKSLFSNYFFMVNILICTGVSIYIAMYPWSWVISLMELEMPPSIPFRALLVGLAFINFFLCYILETFIIDSRILEKVHEHSDKYKKNNLKYIAIEEEVGQNPNWPPISQSSMTLADLMRQETVIGHAHGDLTNNGSANRNNDIDLNSSHTSFGSRKPRNDSVGSYENPCYDYGTGDSLLGQPPDSPKDSNTPLLIVGGEAKPKHISFPMKAKSGDKEHLVKEEVVDNNGTFIPNTSHSTAL